MRLSEKARTTLVRFLAATEAAWKPIRSHEWRSASIIAEARRNRVLRLTGDAGDNRLRKQNQRERDSLQRADLLGPDGITPDGKRLARSWTTLFDASDASRAISRLTSAIDRGDFLRADSMKLVPEQIICGSRDRQQLSLLQTLFVPLLADGVLGSGSDVHGHVLYAPIASAAELENAALSFSTDEYDEGLDDVYCQEYRLRRQQLVESDRTINEIGILPVPPLFLESKRGWDDTGDDPLFVELDDDHPME